MIDTALLPETAPMIPPNYLEMLPESPETAPTTPPNCPQDSATTPSQASTMPSDPPATAPTTARKPTRATLRAQARIAVVADIIEENDGSVPTHLEILNELRRRGVKSSKGTVMNDLYALGLSDAPTAYGRKSEKIAGEF